VKYDKSRREGFIAINLRDGDELVRVVEGPPETTTCSSSPNQA